jgi:hypothetical protein
VVPIGVALVGAAADDPGADSAQVVESERWTG